MFVLFCVRRVNIFIIFIAVNRHSNWETIRFKSASIFTGAFFLFLSVCTGRQNHRDTPPKPSKRFTPTFPERPISCRSAMAACLNRMFMYVESQSESMRGVAERISPGCTRRIEWAWRRARRERKAKQSFLSTFTGCFRVRSEIHSRQGVVVHTILLNASYPAQH